MSIGEIRALTHVIANKEIALLKRYWVNTVSNTITTYVMFLIVFFGGSAVMGQAINDTLPGIIIGFFLWSLSWAAFDGPASSLSMEATWGTLEQLYMSPMGLRLILLIQLLIRLGIYLVISLIILGLMMVTTGKYLNVDLLSVVPLVLLSMGSAVGLGFGMGGLALIYKKISQTFLLLQFLLLFALAAPENPYVFQALPLALGNDLLRQSITEGLSLWELPTTDLTVLVMKAIAYLVIGGLFFEFAVRKAKHRGVMGHY